jgi:hypothetical protein
MFPFRYFASMHTTLYLKYSSGGARYGPKSSITGELVIRRN